MPCSLSAKRPSLAEDSDVTDLATMTALKVDDQALDLRDVLRRLKAKGSIGFLTEVAEDIVMKSLAESEGVAVTGDELQNAVDRYRQVNRLESASATQAWLKANSLSIEELADRVELKILREKLKCQVTEGRAQRYFDDNRESFEAVLLGRVCFGSLAETHVFLQSVRDGAGNYYELAAGPSSEEIGPVPQWVGREDLDPAIEQAVFAAKAGEIAGPLETEKGFQVFKVEAFYEPQLTDSLNRQIRETLFKDWLKDKVRRADIDLAILRHL